MYLLDTHVLLWVVTDDIRLGERTRKALTSGESYVSSVSMAELEIKIITGKLRASVDLEESIEQQGVRHLPLTARHTQALREFPELRQHDPFDRLLLAQAKMENLTLLTADRVLLARGGDWVSDATA
jgi:PIN domain nuclease of toxin-antitoxin system